MEIPEPPQGLGEVSEDVEVPQETPHTPSDALTPSTEDCPYQIFLSS